jgi:hypothetical protein
MFKYKYILIVLSLVGYGYTDSLQVTTESQDVKPKSHDTLVSTEGSLLNDSTERQVPAGDVGQQTDDVSNDFDTEDLKDQIDDEIERLEDKIDEIEDRIDDLRKKKHRKWDEDTIDAEAIFKKIKQHRDAFTETISKSRAQGYGGGAIIQPMLLGIKMEPINELVHHSNALAGYTFQDIDDGYNLMVVSGGIGFGGVGNGMRIGFGGWGGDVLYDGEQNNGYRDSVTTLQLGIGFGGMLVEKAFLYKNYNFLVGGIFGGGSLKVNKRVQSATAFKSFWEDFSEDKNQAKAAFAGLEIHSGFTVTVLSWLHLGMDLNSLALISTSGFGGVGRSGFVTVNPGARLRIVLGNLG